MGPRDSSRTARPVSLVAAREIRERLRARSYLALTALLVVLIIAIGVIGRIAGSQDPDVAEVGLAGADAEEIGEILTDAGATLDRELEVVPIDGDPRSAVEQDEVDLAIDAPSEEIVFADEVDDELVALTQQVWAQRAIRSGVIDAGLDPARAEEILAPEPLGVVSLEDPDDEALAILTGTVVSILLFLSLQTFGNYVLIGVIEEKSTAVVELLLARVRSDQLLAGKVIGIGVTALLQFAVAIAAGLVALAISGTDVPGEIWSTLPVAVLWFLGGYALYSTLYALAGSLVSRQEDAQAASAPIMAVMLGAYLSVFLLGYAPDSPGSTIMSFIPPLAPFLMPMRMAAGAASGLEIVGSFALLVVTIYAVWKLSARIYAQVLLRRGSRITWQDAAALLR